MKTIRSLSALFALALATGPAAQAADWSAAGGRVSAAASISASVLMPARLPHRAAARNFALPSAGWKAVCLLKLHPSTHAITIHCA